MFYALSEHMHIFRNKINLFIALAPVVRIDNCSSGLIKQLSDGDAIENLFTKFNMHEVLANKSNNLATAFLRKFMPEISNLGIKMVCDNNLNELNHDYIEVF